MGNPHVEADTSPLTRAQADDLLRYWLAAIRLEESLKTRPRAQRGKHGAVAPRLDAPALGQAYFKLGLGEDVAALLGRRESLRRAFDGELAAFFEGFLYAQYRRGHDESELSHLLCFPVVHLPRGELAGLLRCGVRLSFGSADGKSFQVPSRAERQRGVYPAPPDQVQVAMAARSEGAWPFFIDTRLLSYPLGLSSEEIDALFEQLRARDSVSECDMLVLLAEALEKALCAAAGELPPPEPAPAEARGAEVEALLKRVTSAMRALLARSRTRAEVYPVAIVMDGTQAKTTWHLQRELVGLIGAHGEGAWHDNGCLGAYLRGHRLEAGEGVQRALFAAPPLTAHQRSAAAHFWGARLTSVQGPPGTGKTTLILHLCAEAIVRQVDALLDAQQMGAELLLVTSGNNRAVDNVMDALASPDALPLGLRVGSRQVCEHALASRLRQTAAWLRRAQAEPLAVRTEALSRALGRFGELRGELAQILSPRNEALARERERRRLERALAVLPEQGELAESPLCAARIPAGAARPLHRAIATLEARLLSLSALCAAKPSMAQVNAVARHYERTAQRELPPFEAALSEAGLDIELPLPPLETPLAPAALMECWEEGAETFLERLTELRERVEHTLGAARLARKARKLAARLAALGPASDEPPPVVESHDELSRALFAAAVGAREAWASVQAAELQQAVELALRAAEQERSLRPLFRNEPEAATLLCRLFGVWGSTLLSLGNCLPAEAGSVARVVIDEAGQCHPAHAVSALVRCKAAMVIGDVHQLPPVIELTADDEARLLRALRLNTDAQTLWPYRVNSESGVSAQSLASRAVQRRHGLVDHFRCHPDVIAISDALCGYGLVVHTIGVRPSSQSALLAHPVSMLDLRGEQARFVGSLCNELELSETWALVERLLARGAAPSDIAIITPYRAQLERLRRGFVERRVPLAYTPELGEDDGAPGRGESGLALGTVHRFQGGERSIVLFSSVVTRVSSLAFLNSRPNLLNVAISRAQDHFVCLGDRDTLLQGPMTRLLVEAAQRIAPHVDA